jgi:cadmium resistance protein CadD (predicted permease)
MNGLFAELAVAIVAFVSTNVDDLLLLSALFIDSRSRTISVVAGQFVGMSLLVIFSIGAACSVASIPDSVIRLTGIVPLSLGFFRLSKWFATQLSGAKPGQQKAGFIGIGRKNTSWTESQTLLALLLTLANGGDNLSVYIPLFAVQRTSIPIYAAAFCVMTAIWCYLAWLLTNHRALRDLLRSHADWIVPCVLIALGLKILFPLSIPAR